MKLRGGLQAKYAVFVAALVSVTLIASGAVDMYFSYRDYRQIVGGLQQEKAVSAAIEIERFVAEIERQVAWSALPLIDLLAVGRDEQRLELGKLLRQVPAIAEAALLDPNGNELAYVARLGLEAQGSGRNWAADSGFLAARSRGTHFGRVHFRQETEPYLTIAAAGRSRSGGAVVVAEVNLKFIRDAISRIDAGPGGRAYVVDADGYLIAHPDLSLVLHKTDWSGFTQVRAARATLSPDTRASIVTPDHSGIPVLTSFAPIPALGWSVFVEQPEAEAFAPVRKALWRGAAILAAGLALSLVASLLLARHVVRPIKALREAASEIGAGRLEHRIAIETGDELESLAREFNRMADRLRESHAGLEAKVEERTRDLAVANRHKSAFLAAMSHELRTPLNAIIGFSDVLQKRMYGELNAKQQKYVDVIHASGKHLLSLIDDILDLSKVEAGKMDLAPAPFNVPEAIEGALALVRGQAEAKSLRLRVDLEPGLPIARADERKFRQILLNLLSNAVKFTPESGIVTVGGRRAAGAVEFFVEDTGPGIPPGDREAIFEEFRQLAGAPNAEGTGLGLALARRLVELHGGTIRVESGAGGGARFVFSLPQPPGD